MAKSVSGNRRKKNKARPTPAREAVSLLSGWVHNRTPVVFVDDDSGLYYPGSLLDSSSENVKLFQFLGPSGISSGIIPRDWTKVTIDEVGGFERIHIVESKVGRRYTVYPDFTRHPDEKEVKKVRQQLAKWQAQQTQLYVHLIHTFYSLAFPGTIAEIKDGWREGLYSDPPPMTVLRQELVPGLTTLLAHGDAPSSTELHVTPSIGAKLVDYGLDALTNAEVDALLFRNVEGDE